MSRTRVRSRAVRLPAFPRDFFSRPQNSVCSSGVRLVRTRSRPFWASQRVTVQTVFQETRRQIQGAALRAIQMGMDVRYPRDRRSLRRSHRTARTLGDDRRLACAGDRRLGPVLPPLSAAVTGPRGRWVTIAVWLALGIGGWPCRSHIGDVTAAGQTSFLPKGAESAQALQALSGPTDKRGQGAHEEVPAMVVFDRAGGLTKDDFEAIGRIGERLNALKITGATPIVDPFAASTGRPLGAVARYVKGIGPVSRDGE